MRKTLWTLTRDKRRIELQREHLPKFGKSNIILRHMESQPEDFFFDKLITTLGLITSNGPLSLVSYILWDTEVVMILNLFKV